MPDDVKRYRKRPVVIEAAQVTNSAAAIFIEQWILGCGGSCERL